MSSACRLSVIVPVRDGVETLSRALSAILASELPREDFELIVVDDASRDSSAEIAGRYADVVVRLTSRRSGAAYARNRGAELAQGDILAFVDADALVRPDTLPRMLKTLSDQPGLDAVSASHGGAPGSRNFISEYWHLLLRFGEQTHTGTSGDIASPCAAIRRDAFLSVGMYDEWRFEAARLEGVELAQRFATSGRDAVSSREVEVTGLRRWNLVLLCREVWDRSTLLARSLGYRRTIEAVPSDVVFTLSRSLVPAMALLFIVAVSAAFLPPPSQAFKVGIIALGAIALNLPAHAFFARARGIPFAIAVAPVHLLMQAVAGLGLCAGWVLRDAVGDSEPDAATQAYAEVGVETWPPVPRASER